MASIELPPGITSRAYSCEVSYATSARPNLQSVSFRKCRPDSLVLSCLWAGTTAKKPAREVSQLQMWVCGRNRDTSLRNRCLATAEEVLTRANNRTLVTKTRRTP